MLESLNNKGYIFVVALIQTCIWSHHCSAKLYSLLCFCANVIYCMATLEIQKSLHAMKKKTGRDNSTECCQYLHHKPCCRVKAIIAMFRIIYEWFALN